MAKPRWDKFEWDDENKKNGNIQHLRDHGIEPRKLRNAFSMITFSLVINAILIIFMCWTEGPIGAEGCDWFFKTRAIA